MYNREVIPIITCLGQSASLYWLTKTGVSIILVCQFCCCYCSRQRHTRVSILWGLCLHACSFSDFPWHFPLFLSFHTSSCRCFIISSRIDWASLTGPASDTTWLSILGPQATQHGGSNAIGIRPSMRSRSPLFSLRLPKEFPLFSYWFRSQNSGALHFPLIFPRDVLFFN